MPKQVVTKEIILNAALEMTRARGFECVNARSLAAYMHRSVQPIYSYFTNMDELKEALTDSATRFYGEYISDNADMLDIKSMAKANVAFAKDETNLFRLLFLSRRKGFSSVSDIFDQLGIKEAAQKLASEKGMSEDRAKQAYMMLIVFTYGISAMLATKGADISDAEADELINKAFTAFTDK